MTIWEWLSYFGIPTLIVGGMFSYFASKIKKIKKEDDAIKKGIQALLRAEMISSYNKYNDLGYAPIYAKESFENVYQNYHALGLNGVMNEIHKTFMELPTDKPKEEVPKTETPKVETTVADTKE